MIDPRLALLPTPLIAAPNLAGALGLRRVWIKRDDLVGPGLGGNKARKLATILERTELDAVDTLVTGGASQSNHARITSAIAAVLGLRCDLVLAGRQPPRSSANLLLDQLLGADITFVTDVDYDALDVAIEARAASLRELGRRPLVIPIGAATADGVDAYRSAGRELTAQTHDVDYVFVADGSGSTHAGLAAGLDNTTVVGVDVGIRPDLHVAVDRMYREAGGTGTITIDTDHVDGGYGIVGDRTRGAVTMLARTEGLLLDPVYSAKAFSALMTWTRDGRVPKDAAVVFWHTGGTPALFASRYAETFTAR
jgi:1-aminocyclopropane-1-carboxylate deaminase/D-cysteine desulfhydrase-like pyridoxal-dependent ACC family enzyme